MARGRRRPVTRGRRVVLARRVITATGRKARTVVARREAELEETSRSSQEN